MSGLSVVMSRLQAASGVTSLVPVSRIYLIEIPQGSDAPCILVSQSGGMDELLLGGQGNYERDRITVECFDTSPGSVIDIAAAIKTALPAINATVGSYSNVGITFANMEFSGLSDDLSLKSKTMDFHVRWKP